MGKIFVLVFVMFLNCALVQAMDGRFTGDSNAGRFTTSTSAGRFVGNSDSGRFTTFPAASTKCKPLPSLIKPLTPIMPSKPAKPDNQGASAAPAAPADPAVVPAPADTPVSANAAPITACNGIAYYDKNGNITGCN